MRYNLITIHASEYRGVARAWAQDRFSQHLPVNTQACGQATLVFEIYSTTHLTNHVDCQQFLRDDETHATQVERHSV
jgi:hypothetical protein